MGTRRTIRVAEVIRKELSQLIQRSNNLEGMLVTISSIDIPPNLKQAYVYVSVLNPDVDREAALAALNKNRREYQQIIGHHLGIKFTPRLVFRFDQAIERGDRVMEILQELDLDSTDTSDESKD